MSKLRSRRFARNVAAPIGMIVAGMLVYGGSTAAFTSTTDNPGNTWSGGFVTLTNNGAGAAGTPHVATSSPAAFTIAGAVPGSTGSKCFVVKNDSSVDGTAKFFVDSVSGAAQAPGTVPLSGYVKLSVDFSAGQYENCVSFPGSPTNIVNNVLLGSIGTSWATGHGSWTPTGGGAADYGTYRVTYTVDAAAPNTAQNGTASVDLNWEIRTP
jgi:hypothetical protein